METRLLLVRHGQTIWNKMHRYAGSSEVALAPEAKPQIHSLTKALKKEEIDVIYSSPLTRCLETIRPTAEHHCLRIIKRVELLERNLGSWEGHTPEQIHLAHEGYHFPESAYDGSFRIPDAEPLDELEGRVRHVLGEIVDAHPGQRVLVATHAGVILLLQARLVYNRPTKLHWSGNCAIARIIATEHHHYRWDGIAEIAEYEKPAPVLTVVT